MASAAPDSGVATAASWPPPFDSGDHHEQNSLLDAWTTDCDCPPPPPPPDFRLPPPPRPPFLYPDPLGDANPEDENALDGSECLDGPLGDIGTCAAVPLVDPEYRSSPALPSIAVIVVCSLLLLAMLLIASVLIWKHKRKVQNFLPCKASPQSRCDGVGAANGVIYEDLTNIRPRTIGHHPALCPGPMPPAGPPAPIEASPHLPAHRRQVRFGQVRQWRLRWRWRAPPLPPVGVHLPTAGASASASCAAYGAPHQLPLLHVPPRTSRWWRRRRCPVAPQLPGPLQPRVRGAIQRIGERGRGAGLGPGQ